MDGLAVSADGNADHICQERSEQFQVDIGETRKRAGPALETPRRLTLDESSTVSAHGRRNSKAVLFQSNSQRKLGDLQNKAIDRDTAELVVDGLPSTEIGSAHPSPDGSWILYNVSHRETGASTPVRIMRMPAHGGAPQLVLEARNVFQSICSAAPASLCAIDERSTDAKVLTITSFVPFNGAGRVLEPSRLTPLLSYNWGLSPDGSKLLVSQGW